MHLLLQGSVYAMLTKNSIFESQGFLNRCLIVFPESMAGQRSYVQADVMAQPEIRRYMDACNQLLDREFIVAPEPPLKNQLQPSLLTVHQDGVPNWIKFHDATDRDSADGGPYRSIRGFGSKAAEHVLRLAGVFAKSSSKQNASHPSSMISGPHSSIAN